MSNVSMKASMRAPRERVLIEVCDNGDQRSRGDNELANLPWDGPDILARLDSRGRHLYLNGAMHEAFGICIIDSTGRTVDQLGFPDEVCQAYASALQTTLRSGRQECFEFHCRVNGRRRYFSARMIPEFDQNADQNADRSGPIGGRIASVLVIACDMTRCREATIERDALLLRAKEMSDRAQTQMQILIDSHRKALAGIAHDLRSPLNGIQNWAHVLENYLSSENYGSENAPIRRALTGIKTGVEQQVRLINGMLEMGEEVAEEAPEVQSSPGHAPRDGET